MGKSTGFIERSRVAAPRRPVAERLGDWREVYRPREIEESRAQGARCMDCGVPFCQQGCPLGNEIPDWNDLVYRDRWRDAYWALAATNNFPEFTGRLCPAPCEGACTLAINQPAVTIEEIEKEIIERAFAEGWVEPQTPTVVSGKSVAVVGSGPAGLAAAAQLRRAGHRVVVYESGDRIGGLLRYGIPDFKMEKEILDRRLAIMEGEGVIFEPGVRVGEAIGWNQLRREHDAVLIAIGARVPRDLPIPGRELAGVVFAMDYLERQNRAGAGDPLPAAPDLEAGGKRVAILGGGDTGSDCLGTALRQGARSVTQIELMPRPPEARGASNPWPQWPLVFRTSSSQEEGGERDFALLTKEFVGSGGKLEAIRAVRVEAEGGRLREVAGSETTTPVELALIACGYLGPDAAPIAAELGLELDARGNVAVGPDFATSVPGVFAAGDAQRGQSLIVWAISDGREAARSIDVSLRQGADTRLPSRGRDLPY
jgi:glutamate synthase (NADPH/NADH) small chain